MTSLPTARAAVRIKLAAQDVRPAAAADNYVCLVVFVGLLLAARRGASLGSSGHNDAF